MIAPHLVISTSTGRTSPLLAQTDACWMWFHNTVVRLSVFQASSPATRGVIPMATVAHQNNRTMVNSVCHRLSRQLRSSYEEWASFLWEVFIKIGDLLFIIRSTLPSWRIVDRTFRSRCRYGTQQSNGSAFESVDNIVTQPRTGQVQLSAA